MQCEMESVDFPPIRTADAGDEVGGNAVVWFITAIALINALCYFLVWLNWRRDVREIGKDRLAVPLRERFQALFLLLTLPCVLGFVWGLKGGN